MVIVLARDIGESSEGMTLLSLLKKTSYLIICHIDIVTVIPNWPSGAMVLIYSQITQMAGGNASALDDLSRGLVVLPTGCRVWSWQPSLWLFQHASPISENAADTCWNCCSSGRYNSGRLLRCGSSTAGRRKVVFVGRCTTIAPDFRLLGGCRSATVPDDSSCC